jgi:uncharacterized membrane protein
MVLRDFAISLMDGLQKKAHPSIEKWNLSGLKILLAMQFAQPIMAFLSSTL